MYLTKVTLKPCSHLNFLLKTPQNLHAAISETFDGSNKRWRLDSGNVLWVTSEAEPTSPQSLPGEFNTRSLEPLRTGLKVGQKIAFRVKVAPSKSIAPEEGKRGKALWVYGDEEQMEWIAGRLNKSGLDILAYALVDKGIEKFAHRGGDIKFPWVTFEGSATIKDTEALIDSLENGIGKKGGYGAGLLTIAGR